MKIIIKYTKTINLELPSISTASYLRSHKGRVQIFYKNMESRFQNEDLKEVTSWGSSNVGRHHTKFRRPTT